MAKKHKASLTQGPIVPMLARLTLPMIMGVVSIVAFNLVDSFFIGQMGELELAALGFTIPVVLILNSIGMGLGMGAAAVVSKAVGEENKEKVQRLTTDSLVLALLFAGLFVTVGLLTLEPTFRMLGASEQVLPLIREYMEIWYIGVIFVIVPFVGNSAIRANGDSRTPALIMVSMVMLNIVLDPLLIFGLGPFPEMGMRGAALATVIARAASLVLGLYFLRFRYAMVSLRLPSLNEMIHSWRGILYIGLPAAATNLVVPFTTALITELVSGYGEAAVAALGVASRIDLVAITVVVALSSILGPFVGQNLGANKLERVREGIRKSILFGLGWGLLMFVVIGSLRSYIAPLFNDEEDVITAIVLYLSIAPLGYAARCVYALGNTILNVLNRPYHASGITLGMMFLVYIPLAYLGSSLFGLGGVFAAIPLAFTLGGTASYLMVRWALKQEEQKVQAKLGEEAVVL
jgi:putative MATE family efflux protein